MPIVVPAGLRRLSDHEFKQAAYAVVEACFAVHNEFGRLFDEQVYQAEVARRLPGSRARVAFEVCFKSFSKIYYLDLLFRDGAVFELKTSGGFASRHRAQLLNYLLCLDLPHGKLINFRTESLEHEFVNAPLSREERTRFLLSKDGYREVASCPTSLIELVLTVLRDWGTCLELSLYEEVITHFFGGEQAVLKPVDVVVEGRRIGTQPFRLLSYDTAFRLTAFEGEIQVYEHALRRLLEHVALGHLQWVNIAKRNVTLKTLSR